MNSLTRAFGILIAANFQAIAIIMLAWWGGEWLNEHHPIGTSWYAITFPVAVIVAGHTFYVVIRHAIRQNAAASRDAPAEPNRQG